MSYIYKIGRIKLREQIRKHSKYIQGKVLDIGAGNFSRYKDLFNFTEYIKMETTPGEGIDVVGRIETIPFESNSFDSIVCTQVLGDIYELPKAFGELHRVLRPGGTVLITESLFDPLHDEPNDFWRFTSHSLRRLAEDSGFTIVTIESRGGYWSVMAQLKARYWIER
ncbi:MAG: class I SAM-dependent methyltransferase, partial [Patescibacteria group bacterium]